MFCACPLLGLQHLVAPSIDLSHFSTECWAVLAFSFLIDGWILTRTIKQIRSSQPPGISFFKHLRSVRDPTTQAVFMEDAADCIGVVVAITGVGVSQLTGMAVWDSVAGVGISVLLGGVGLYLARLNQRYLLGHAVDPGERMLTMPSR
jgi:zinc transporter 9